MTDFFNPKVQEVNAYTTRDCTAWVRIAAKYIKYHEKHSWLPSSFSNIILSMGHVGHSGKQLDVGDETVVLVGVGKLKKGQKLFVVSYTPVSGGHEDANLTAQTPHGAVAYEMLVPSKSGSDLKMHPTKQQTPAGQWYQYQHIFLLDTDWQKK
ncbi:hypothetical protein [Streptomyces varsoviensis]|uniref:Uncharacterized protein n=1 Tax=Streptomyces varsoviensis TaxID=67373 RepID=A0ABR5IVR4_9ACTN|nr:hypothetical protein [Streptomyces varsoviensis]KOG85253.1 hypothetical protein ADK38_37720 [Streptomyces varsoviensis]